ncbi:hypothetical protein IAR50_003725 [Cryptococcus sp. DSM 104548]
MPYSPLQYSIPGLMDKLQEAKSWARQVPKRKIVMISVTVASVLLLLHGFVAFWPTPDVQTMIQPLESFHDSGKTLRRDSWISVSDYDIVVAHYDEDASMMRESIDAVLQRLPSGKSHRTIIYHKGDRNKAGLRELLEFADEVTQIPNVGREGETYLNHIARVYNEPRTGLAEHTLFMQPHLAWHWVFIPRLEKLIRKNTGFLSFGPYINQTCGLDNNANSFPRLADIYSMFRNDFCPPVPQLATWAGQFIVSRKRILDNPLRTYENLRAKFHAVPEHWIWKEGWWDNKPSNPTLGHALERAWPVIFDCTDGTISVTCSEDSGETCQCLD